MMQKKTTTKTGSSGHTKRREQGCSIEVWLMMIRAVEARPG